MSELSTIGYLTTNNTSKFDVFNGQDTYSIHLPKEYAGYSCELRKLNPHVENKKLVVPKKEYCVNQTLVYEPKKVDKDVSRGKYHLFYHWTVSETIGDGSFDNPYKDIILDRLTEDEEFFVFEKPHVKYEWKMTEKTNLILFGFVSFFIGAMFNHIVEAWGNLLK